MSDSEAGPSWRIMTKRAEPEVKEEEMDERIQQMLEELDSCQSEIMTLNEKAAEEMVAVELKYSKLRKPHFEERNGIIDKVPGFWVTVLVNHPQISLLIDEDDEDCLHYLTRLEVESLEELMGGFRIKLVFDENPFFENETLVKEINWTGPVPISTSTEIKWKDESMNLSKKKGQDFMTRCKRGLEQRTFFSWYSDNTDPFSDDIAEIIKDDLWPNPLQYYLASELDEESGLEEDSSDRVEDDFYMGVGVGYDQDTDSSD